MTKSTLTRALAASLALAVFSPTASALVVIQLPEPGTAALIGGSIAAAVLVARFWRRK